MSNNRKLQAEISQVIKKIEEGMNEFDEIWEKVYSADTQAHKERWEAELKKEIKKLQRFRDQIKGWISSPDVKDKTPLTEARKVCNYVQLYFPSLSFYFTFFIFSF